MDRLPLLNSLCVHGVATVLVAGAVFTASPVAAQWKPDTAGVATQPIEINVRQIESFAKNGTPFDNARLAWRGGLVLASPSKNFGGWSGLALARDGKSLVAVSDSGLWMTAAVAYDGERLKGLSSARIGALKAVKGKPLTRQRDRDAEAITIASGSPSKGTAYIAFEQHDRIGVFDVSAKGVGPPKSYLTLPKEAARMRMDGFESLAVLAGGPHKGALVAFAENPLRGEKLHRGWIWIGGEPRGFTVAGLGGFSITDAASLPDGSVVLIERRFRWLEGLRIRLRLLPADVIKAGATASGEVLLEADTSQEIDNLEGLAVSETAAGETILTLISDDNFNRFLQRTVLLQFALTDRKTARAMDGAAPIEPGSKKRRP
jgi:hypothetical protein